MMRAIMCLAVLGVLAGCGGDTTTVAERCKTACNRTLPANLSCTAPQNDACTASCVSATAGASPTCGQCIAQHSGVKGQYATTGSQAAACGFDFAGTFLLGDPTKDCPTPAAAGTMATCSYSIPVSTGPECVDACKGG